MFQPSFERAKQDGPEVAADEDFCPHCGRGGMPPEEELELELASDEEEPGDPDPVADKAAFIAALRKESR